jgi:hypothetical protein
MTLAASATRMLLAKWVPALIMDWYKELMKSAISGVEPEVTFKISSTRCSLSPGLMRSGLYPAKKSTLKVRFEMPSRIGMQTSSVAPGYTVDS